MAFIFLKEPKLDIPQQHAKVIKAADFFAYKMRSEIVYEAFERSHLIIHEAEGRFAEQQEKGYKAGLHKAQAEQALRMMEIVNQTVDYIQSVEHQLSMLVYDAVKEIISDYDSNEKLIAIVKATLATMRGQKQITVKVSPENSAFLRQALDELLSTFPMVSHIEIVEQSGIALDSCIVSTEIGSAEASVAAQMEALRRSLEKVFVPATEDNGLEADKFDA